MYGTRIMKEILALHHKGREDMGGKRVRVWCHGIQTSLLHLFFQPPHLSSSWKENFLWFSRVFLPLFHGIWSLLFCFSLNLMHACLASFEIPSNSSYILTRNTFWGDCEWKRADCVKQWGRKRRAWDAKERATTKEKMLQNQHRMTERINEIFLDSREETAAGLP